MNGSLGASRKKINFYASCSSRPTEKSKILEIFTKIFRELIAGFYEPCQPATIFPAIEIPIALSVFLFVLSAKNIFEVIRWIIYWEERNRCTKRTRFREGKNLKSGMKWVSLGTKMGTDWRKWFFEHRAFVDVEGKWRHADVVRTAESTKCFRDFTFVFELILKIKFVCQGEEKEIFFW